MKKKTVIFAVSATLLALILFLPIPTGKYDDGGTREYSALTYKIVKWNKLESVYEGGEMTRVDKYTKTSVYWIPDNFKSIDDLWKLEQAK